MNTDFNDLIKKSKEGDSYMELSHSLGDFIPNDFLKKSKKYIAENEDASAYLLLLILKEKYNEAYHDIGNETKAKIFSSAIQNVNYFNDWSILDTEDSQDRIAAEAILETGVAAIDFLKPILDDSSPAPMFGSEEATLSSIYEYRKRDFAWYLISKILGKDATFYKSVSKRDKLIEELKLKI